MESSIENTALKSEFIFFIYDEKLWRKILYALKFILKFKFN